MSTQEIDFIVSVALKETVEVLGPEFEAETGYRLNVVHMLNPEVPDFIGKGARWDIALTNPWHVNEIVEAGHSESRLHHLLGRSPLAFAKRGSKEGIVLQTAEEIAEMLRRAQSIVITRTGTSGEMFRTLAKKLGVWTEIEAVVCPMEAGVPIRALVAGKVEMATVPLTNIVTIEGIVTVATCPEDLESPIGDP